MKLIHRRASVLDVKEPFGAFGKLSTSKLTAGELAEG
jgi:hypothetical protein